MSVVQGREVLSKHADHRREGVQDPTAALASAAQSRLQKSPYAEVRT